MIRTFAGKLVQNVCTLWRYRPVPASHTQLVAAGQREVLAGFRVKYVITADLVETL